MLIGGCLAMVSNHALAQSPEHDLSRVRIAAKIPLKAEPFSLRDVRLLDGPFKHAMEMDGKYMLEL